MKPCNVSALYLQLHLILICVVHQSVPQFILHNCYTHTKIFTLTQVDVKFSQKAFPFDNLSTEMPILLLAIAS